MKKTLIAASVIVLATIANAASVNWGGAVATADGSGYLNTGTTAYLLYSDSAMSAATSLEALSIGSTANNGGSIVATYALTSADLNTSSSFVATYNKAGSDVNGFYAILVQDTTQSNKLSYYDMGEISGTTATSSAYNLTLNTAWSNYDDYLTNGGWTVAVGAVPEPTSGLLMLLGITGLALRRRRA